MASIFAITSARWSPMARELGSLKVAGSEVLAAGVGVAGAAAGAEVAAAGAAGGAGVETGAAGAGVAGTLEEEEAAAALGSALGWSIPSAKRAVFRYIPRCIADGSDRESVPCSRHRLRSLSPRSCTTRRSLHPSESCLRLRVSM